MAWVDVSGSNGVWEYENAATAANTYPDSADGANSTVSGGIRTYTKPGTSDVTKTYLRVRKKGQINLFHYSEQFDNAYWLSVRSTITADQGVAPDGTTTADLVTQATSTAGGAIAKNDYSPLTNGAVYTYSLFAKYVTGSDIKFIMMQDYNITSGAALNRTWFNIETGAIGTSDSDHTTTTTDVGNGWFRFTVTITSGNTGGNFAIYRSNTDGSTTATLNDSYLMWGIQLNEGTVLTPYIKTGASASTTIERGELSKTYYDNQ